VSKAVADISTTTAIADSDLSVGQPASLYMKDGLLFASKVIKGKGAKGTTVTEAKKGQDIGIRNIEGVIKLEPARVMIGRVPNVQDGGSSSTSLARLDKEAKKVRLVGALGTEALVALRQTRVKPDYIHGVREAAIEAAYCGLSFLVVCSEDKVPVLVQRLEEENLNYEIVDLKKR
jgi:putative transcriptional regulator